MKKEHVSLQRRPFLTPIWLFALAALIAAVIMSLAVWWWGTADSTTVVVIRDAEKALGTVADPPLTEAGEERAALLARMLGDAKSPGHIGAIYISPALPDRLTAAPLAARLGLSPIVVTHDDPKELVRRVLREHAGGRILIIGHGDTVPTIVAALCGNEHIPDIGAEEYGTMYIVTVPRIGRANLLRLSY